MKALIFAAGVGSRLKPWTDSHPKALVEVGGKPMLQRVIEKVVRAGIADIIINVHHFAPQIAEFVAAHDFGARITLSDETDCLLETGGGLAKVVPLLGGEPVLIHNADILTDFDLRSMVFDHVRSNAVVTLLTQPRDTARHLVFRKSDRRMCGWINTATGVTRPSALEITGDMFMAAFDGVHIVEPEAYAAVRAYRPAGTPFSITDFYIDRCDDLPIRSFSLPENAAWYDIGKPETLEKARNFIENK